MALDYATYLRLEQLLSLQGGASGRESELAKDELLFVVVHQIDELWFKLALRELARVRDVFAQDLVHEQEVAPAAAGLRRVLKALELATAHFALIETMSPRDFLDFRAKLAPASGFQSPQFRELEILLGLPAQARARLLADSGMRDPLGPRSDLSGWAREKVDRRLEETVTLKDALSRWLYRTPIDGSRPVDRDDDKRVAEFVESFLARHGEEVRLGREHARASGILDPALERQFEVEIAEARRFLTEGPREQRRTRAAALFIELYRELPLLSWPREVLDLIVQVEQAFLVFRQRHARMVERMIGRRVGTGGSDGVRYLDDTALRYRVFSDLWEVRRILVRADAKPPLRHADKYEYRSQA
jgi:tryptophan 2,3-dioxygenase